MTNRPLLRLAVALTGVLAWGAAAQAQSSACQRLRAELASLGSGGGRAAAGQRAEIGRLTGYYHSVGCSQGGFFGPPPECGAIAQRINALQASYGQAAASNDGARRRQLLAAIQQACQPQREARLEVRPVRAPVERPVEKPVERSRRASLTQEDDRDSSRSRSLGGSRIVCVRACDGFFFPLQTTPNDGRSGADQLCQALCPGAETAAYTMPNGEDTELDRAVSFKGRPYTRLANAFKFQKGFDKACSCKKEGQTWAQALTRAEAMLGRQKGDMIVTAKKAEELSRPKIALAAKRGRDKPKPLDVETTGSLPGSQTEAEAVSLSKAQIEAAKASEAAASPAKPEDTTAVPTASRASAGIGPKAIESAKVVARTEGIRREVTDDQGVKRTVRIIAPSVIPVPAQVQASAR